MRRGGRVGIFIGIFVIGFISIRGRINYCFVFFYVFGIVLVVDVLVIFRDF